ncbi:MAG: hypothetical protein E7354_05255 [Clostridiales bacterium]|nr:hypothetical protein [Clostridiales bacterium]
MEVVAERRLGREPSYWLIQNIVLALFTFVMGAVVFFGGDRSYTIVIVLGAIFGVVGLLFIVFGIKNLIRDSRDKKLPNTAISKDGETLVLQDIDSEYTVPFEDIVSIRGRGYLRFMFAPYFSNRGYVRIKTNDTTYTVYNVNCAKHIVDKLRELVWGVDAEMLEEKPEQSQ